MSEEKNTPALQDSEAAEVVEKIESGEFKPIPIDSLNEESIKGATIAQCEDILRLLHVANLQLRAKATIVASRLEQATRESEIARKAAGNSRADDEAMLAHLQEKARIRADESFSDEEKAAALAKLSGIHEKPPAQHIDGSFIEKDKDDVNPGGNA